MARGDFTRWLYRGPRDLMRPFPAGPDAEWPISTRVSARKAVFYSSITCDDASNIHAMRPIPSFRAAS
jgi:hypothetical protein